jgi:hypothetical protein
MAEIASIVLTCPAILNLYCIHGNVRPPLAFGGLRCLVVSDSGHRCMPLRYRSPGSISQLIPAHSYSSILSSLPPSSFCSPLRPLFGLARHPSPSRHETPRPPRRLLVFPSALLDLSLSSRPRSRPPAGVLFLHSSVSDTCRVLRVCVCVREHVLCVCACVTGALSGLRKQRSRADQARAHLASGRLSDRSHRGWAGACAFVHV